MQHSSHPSQEISTSNSSRRFPLPASLLLTFSFPSSCVIAYLVDSWPSMRFFHKPSPKKAPLRTSDVKSSASSEELSELLLLLEQAEADIATDRQPPSAYWLDRTALLKLGKVHTERILASWVECQSYLTQAELAALTRRSATYHRPSGDESQTLSETTSQTGVTSRTSSYMSLTRPTSLPSNDLIRGTSYKRSLKGRIMNKRPPTLEVCQGFRYEPATNSSVSSLVQPELSEVEWTRLNDAWRTSLHLQGPKTNKRPAKT